MYIYNLSILELDHLRVMEILLEHKDMLQLKVIQDTTEDPTVEIPRKRKKTSHEKPLAESEMERVFNKFNKRRGYLRGKIYIIFIVITLLIKMRLVINKSFFEFQPIKIWLIYLQNLNLLYLLKGSENKITYFVLYINI